MSDLELVCVECGDDLACEGWEQCTECLYNGVKASPRQALPLPAVSPHGGYVGGLDQIG